MSRKLQVAVFLVGITVFSVIIWHAGVPGLLRSLHAARSALLPSVLAWGVVYACNTLAWSQLASDEHGPPIPFLRAYIINVASFALNYVTPLVALGGEGFRIAAASAWMDSRRAAASVVSFRIVHSLSQVMFWLTAVPIAFMVLPRSRTTTALLIALAVVLGTVAFLLISLFRNGFVERALNLLQRIPLLRALARRLEPRRAALVAIDSQMASLYRAHRRRLIAAAVLEYAGRSIAMLEWYFIAHALGQPISYPTAYAIGAFQQLVINATFFVPFAMGTNEGALTLIFSLLGLPAVLGTEAAIVGRLREMIWIAIGLGLTWVVRRGTTAAPDTDPDGATATASPARDTTPPSPAAPPAAR